MTYRSMITQGVLGLAAITAMLGAADPGAAPAANAAKPPDVTVEVFSDFQCPFCGQFAAPVRELESKGVEGITMEVTFRHFPLSFHADAQLAHQAAVAAGNQGKFWEMHDLMFANQSALK